MEVSGHTAAMGHTWALGNAQDHRDTDGDMVHGGCIHIMILQTKFLYSLVPINLNIQNRYILN